jgi:hypothetical protein
MTGSIALDVVIGLVFIYLLYSLFATVVCEIVAVHLGFRERNLKQAIRRMLEDFPETSENKIVAFFRHIKQTFGELFVNYHGPATCVFYHLPLIKYFARSTLQSKPAYISKQNFSSAILEIFRRYGGGDDANDLEKVLNVLKGKVQHTNEFASLKEAITIDPQTNAPYLAGVKLNYDAIFDLLKEKAAAINVKGPGLDTAQRIIFRKIQKLLKGKKKTDEEKKAAVYKVDEMLNLFGRETRSHLNSLLKDSGNDLFKFRLHLEQWFDDTMERAAGWYKQKVQFALLIIGLFIAITFNADTLSIVGKLSVNEKLRDKMVENAARTVNDPRTKQMVESIRNAKPDTTAVKKEDQQAKRDSLDAVRREIQRQLDEAHTLLGTGWISLPENLPLLPYTEAAAARMKELKEKRLIDYAIIAVYDSSRKQQAKMILEFPRGATSSILCCLQRKKVNDTKVFFSKHGTSIAVSNGFGGHSLYLLSNIFSGAFWGYLLTAIAISLGAPFWFDLLSKLVQVRGAVKTSTPSSTDNAAAKDKNLSDPAHVLNRKG